MSSPLVRVERAGAVVRVILNDPERRNPLSYAMVRSLVTVLREADVDPAVRVVVLQGAGDHFSAGADLKEFAEELRQPAGRHWETGGLWQELFGLLPALRTPVIAAVRGYALGGGCGLVAASDLALAADDARFGFTEIRVGLFPLLVLPALQRTVGLRRAMELALTGAVLDAAEAARIGLVTRVVPRDSLDRTTEELAEVLAGYSPEALALGRRLFWAVADLDYGAALHLARSMRVLYFASEGVREGVQAFVDRRSPRW
jgi:methylglutaconyl-CoA hydratase